MKLCIYTLVLLFLAIQAMGRQDENLRKANYLYAHLAYHDAIEYYTKASPMPGDAATLAKIGDCFRLTKDPQQANVWYAKAIARPDCAPVIKLHYAETLMNTGDYAAALPLLQQYVSANPKDRRAANLVASCEHIDSMKTQPATGFANLLAFNTDKSEFGPAIRHGQLFFSADTVIYGDAKTDKWTGAQYYNIYSVNNNMTDKYGAMVQLPGKANDKFHNGPCTFSTDGSVMYFTRTNYVQKFLTKDPVTDQNNIVRLETMIATDYDETTKKYKTVTPFEYNGRDYSVAHAVVSKDDSKLFFVSDMKGGYGGTDIYICERMADGTWGKPQNAGQNINTEGNELTPYIDLDNTLYFASDGHIGYGGLDLYKSVWNESTHSYAQPVNMGMPINSSYDDMSLTFTFNDEAGYFASNRPAEKKGDNIYSFTPRSFYLSLKGIDSITRLAVPDYTLTLIGSNDSFKIKPDNNGYLFARLYPQIKYTWRISAPHYQPQYLSLLSSDSSKLSDTLYATVKFNPNTDIALSTGVYDQNTDIAVQDSKVLIYKTGQAIPDTIEINTLGQFKKPLEPDNVYHIKALKTSYTGQEKVISTKGLTPELGQVIISEDLYIKHQ